MRESTPGGPKLTLLGQSRHIRLITLISIAHILSLKTLEPKSNLFLLISMAPKRRGSIFGTATVTKKRSVRPPPPPSPSSSSSSSSSTPSATPGSSSQPIDTLAGKVITMGRKVDFGFFEDEGFEIGRQIKEMGWLKVCSLDVPTYPALVKEFYANLSRGDGGLVSHVRSSRIHITSAILGKLLDLPVTGPTAHSHSDRGAALSRLMGREVVDFEEVRANQLPLELRLLHNICGRILFPKTGRFEYVSERDILVMDSVITGQPINLPGMIIWYMAEAGGKKRSTLPYGMILTLIFRSQGVVIMESEPKKSLRHTDYYNLATVHRMGFIKKDGSWIRKGSLEAQNNTNPSVPGPSMQRTSPPLPSPIAPPAPTPFSSSSIQASTSFSDTQLDQLKSLLTEHKNEIKAELDNQTLNFKELLYSLEDRVSRIESTLGISAESLKKDLMNIFDQVKDIGGDSDIYSKRNVELQDKIETASAFFDDRLNEFIKVQRDGMGQLLEQLKKSFYFCGR